LYVSVLTPHLFRPQSLRVDRWLRAALRAGAALHRERKVRGTFADLRICKICKVYKICGFPSNSRRTSKAPTGEAKGSPGLETTRNGTSGFAAQNGMTTPPSGGVNPPHFLRTNGGTLGGRGAGALRKKRRTTVRHRKFWGHAYRTFPPRHAWVFFQESGFFSGAKKCPAVTSGAPFRFPRGSGRPRFRVSGTLRQENAFGFGRFGCQWFHGAASRGLGRL